MSVVYSYNYYYKFIGYTSIICLNNDISFI